MVRCSFMLSEWDEIDLIYMYVKRVIQQKPWRYLHARKLTSIQTSFSLFQFVGTMSLLNQWLDLDKHHLEFASTEQHFQIMILLANTSPLEIKNSWSWCLKTLFVVMFINEDEKRNTITITAYINLYFMHFVDLLPTYPFAV